MPPEKRERNLAIAKDYNETTLSVKELREKYGLSKNTMTKLLNTLEARGDIKPRPSRLANRLAHEQEV